MKASKILCFYNNANPYLPGSECERVIKKYATAPNNPNALFSRVCDYPKWEETLNSYLNSGWSVASMTGTGGSITVLLIREV